MKDVKEKEEKTTTKTKNIKSKLKNNKRSIAKHKDNSKNEEEKATFNLIEVIIIMIITAVFGILIGSCSSYFRNETTSWSTNPAFSEFINVYNDIVSEYYGEVDKDKLLESGIKGMVDYLNDPYSSYLDYDATNDLNLELEGEYVGMGATITVDENYVVISDLFENSPAAMAGLKIGDQIIKIDGKEINGNDLDSVSEMIIGEVGTKVSMTIRRDGVEISTTLVRGKVIIPSVHYQVLEGTDIGYIEISVFAKNTPEQFIVAMNELQLKEIKSLIIDVRDNSGGYLSSAEKIISYFVDKGKVMYQLDTKGVVEKVVNKNEKKYDVEVLILTNKNSASASEILASSLKENVDAIIVGEKTFGKGTVQKAVQLSSGAMIKYTVQEWLTPNGNKINRVGVIPDYEISLDKEDTTNDLQLKKAIELLKK